MASSTQGAPEYPSPESMCAPLQAQPQLAEEVSAAAEALIGLAHRVLITATVPPPAAAALAVQLHDTGGLAGGVALHLLLSGHHLLGG